MSQNSQASRPPLSWWDSKEKLQLVRDTFAADATDNEFELFKIACQQSGLDPLARQIYAIFDKDRMEVRATIDGFRVIAERKTDEKGEHLYEGQGPTLWCGDDGEWRDAWISAKPPFACKVTVFRKGFREPLVVVARFESYAVYDGDDLVESWAKMPDIMIAKCAESLALRKAFPQDLSGIYTVDEMQQAQTTGGSRRRAKDTTTTKTEKPAKGGKKAKGKAPKDGVPEWQDAVIHFGKKGGPLLGAKLSELSQANVTVVKEYIERKPKRTLEDNLLLGAIQQREAELTATQSKTAPADTALERIEKEKIDPGLLFKVAVKMNEEIGKHNEDLFTIRDEDGKWILENWDRLLQGVNDELDNLP
jgi:phage recombination protein Bet